MKILVCVPCFECIVVNVVMSSWGIQQTGNGWKRIHVHASVADGIKGLVKRPSNVLASLPILFFVGICKDVWWILSDSVFAAAYLLFIEQLWLCHFSGHFHVSYNFSSQMKESKSVKENKWLEDTERWPFRKMMAPLINQSIEWFVHSFIHSLTDWLVHSFIHWLIDSFIHSLICWLIHWFIDSLIDSLFDWLIHWFIHLLIHLLWHTAAPLVTRLRQWKRCSGSHFIYHWETRIMSG